METKKVVDLTDKYWSLRLAWLDGKYQTKEQKDELIKGLLELVSESLRR